jgi:hypothetical protein
MLFLDIETAPNLAMVWGIWQENIPLARLVETGYILCWSAKWRGSKEVLFDSTYKSGKDGVIKSMWKLLDEADAVVHYNGKRFDIPTLNREFLIRGMRPPSPYKQIDLLQTVRNRFRFVSAKLEHITKQLGFRGKIKTDMELWIQVMKDNPRAWAKMERYNKRDTTELEGVYNKLLPWIENHANVALYHADGRPACTVCGSTRVQQRGLQRSRTQVYLRYQCTKCGSWLRSRLAEKQPHKKSALTQIGE